MPLDATLIRVVVPACKSLTKMSGCELVSLATRLVAAESNATNLPLELTALETRLVFEKNAPLNAFPSTPADDLLTNCVAEAGGRLIANVAGLEEMERGERERMAELYMRAVRRSVS